MEKIGIDHANIPLVTVLRAMVSISLYYVYTEAPCSVFAPVSPRSSSSSVSSLRLCIASYNIEDG